MTKLTGTKVVLTASEIEMDECEGGPLASFVPGSPIGRNILESTKRRTDASPGRTAEGRAKYAPYGLRKVEALLLENGFSESDVAVVHPRDLKHFIGPKTKVVGISSMNPAGKGYVGRTYASIVGKEDSGRAPDVRKLLNHSSIKKFKPVVVLGGFGSWQLEAKNERRRGYSVDCVVIGSGKEGILKVFAEAVEGRPLPRVVRSEESFDDSDHTNMPSIMHAATYGTVEISKGCGRKCQFCPPTMQVRYDIPPERIRKEVEVNLNEGADCIYLAAEDFLMYGASNNSFVPSKTAPVNLLRDLAKCSGLKAILPSNFSFAPVVCNPSLVQEASQILLEYPWYSYGGRPIVMSETGMETGSSRLMQKYMANKMLPFEAEQWTEIINQAMGILNDNYWFPIVSIIVGLPDEKEDDIVETFELLDDLEEFRALYVPLIFSPLETNRALSRMSLELIAMCWKYNIRIWKDPIISKGIDQVFISKIAKSLLDSLEKLKGLSSSG
jgi:radical SAM superfamily enzyme YgiQ (UPF0313 family)